MQRTSFVNRRHSSTIDSSTTSLILHAAARAMISDMRATYSAQSARRGSTGDAPDSDLKSRRVSNPPSFSSSTAAASNANSSSSSSSSSRTPKRAGQGQGQSASKWGALNLSASTSASILTSSYDFDNGNGCDGGTGYDNDDDSVYGYGTQISDSESAAVGRESYSTCNNTESEILLFQRPDSERLDKSGENELAMNKSINENSSVTQNPSGALDDSDIPLEEDFGECIGGSSNLLFSPLRPKSRKSRGNSEALRDGFNKRKGASNVLEGAGPHPHPHPHSDSKIIVIEEAERVIISSTDVHSSSIEESVTELYDISDADLLDIAAQSQSYTRSQSLSHSAVKNKKSKRIFPATPDTNKKLKKRRKSEKDSIDDIFGDI